MEDDKDKDRDKYTELLTRVSANHLFLGQFEPFRATLRSLRARNPDLARSILQSIVSRGGRLGQPDPIIWSDPCPSRETLTFLCMLELLQYPNPTSDLWSFDTKILKLRAEFLLYVYIVCSRVRGSVSVEGSDGFGDEEVVRVLERVSGLGLRRLRPDLVESEEVEVEGGDWKGLEEGDFMKLRGAVLENCDVFDALCGNIGEQVGCVGSVSGELAVSLRTSEVRRGEEAEKEEEVLRLVQKCVQVTHLDAMRQCLEEGDEDGAISHVRFLHLDHGVEEAEYRYVQDYFSFDKR